jgi:hypothetical protein
VLLSWGRRTPPAPAARTGRPTAGRTPVGITVAAGAVTAVLAWPVVDGFLVDRLGVLAWHGPADLWRAAALAAAGLAGGAGWRWLGRIRDHRAWRAECRTLLAAGRGRDVELDVLKEERRDA